MNSVIRRLRKAHILGLLALVGAFAVYTACFRVHQANHVAQKYLNDLDQVISGLEELKRVDMPKREAQFREVRKHFKQAEMLLAYLDVENYKYLNQPNLLKVHEEDLTDIKVMQPSGLQVIEESLEEDESFQLHCDKSIQRFKLIRRNNVAGNLTDYQFLWALKDQIIRIATTGITGFDSPVLEASCQEAAWSYRAMLEYLYTYRKRYRSSELWQSWVDNINDAIKELKRAEFESFDRYRFIQAHTNVQLQLWRETIADWQVDFPFERAISDTVDNLFSKHLLNYQHFSGKAYPGDSLYQLRVRIGKQLFADKRLSNSKDLSCASCHVDSLGFSDGLKFFPGQRRNSPTIAYAGFQRGFFHDARAGSLEEQIISVIKNESEFNTSLAKAWTSIEGDAELMAAIDSLKENRGSQPLLLPSLIADYVRSVAPFSSDFDRSMRGKMGEATLKQQAIDGFNLFMGKAKCATCHFPPLFNGTVPVHYTESELEALGVPNSPDTAMASISPDLGRFEIFKTEERKHFFKTPTIRNAAKTGPYMHNGVYTDMESLIDFYNRGGGAGIGIDLPMQTLPPDPLGLDSTEVQALIVFMESLSDKP